MSYVGDLKALRRMLEMDIEREGEVSSFMVRAGLLRDVLDELEAHRSRTPTDLERMLGEAVKAGVELVEWLSREITECQRLSDDAAGHEHWERIAGSKYDGRLASYQDQFSQALAKYRLQAEGE